MTLYGEAEQERVCKEILNTVCRMSGEVFKEGKKKRV